MCMEFLFLLIKTLLLTSEFVWKDLFKKAFTANDLFLFDK